MDQAIAQHTRLGNFGISHVDLFAPGDSTLGLHVLRSGVPAGSWSITALGALMMFRGIWWFGQGRAAGGDCNVSERRRADLGGCRYATESGAAKRLTGTAPYSLMLC